MSEDLPSLGSIVLGDYTFCNPIDIVIESRGDGRILIRFTESRDAGRRLLRLVGKWRSQMLLGYER